MLIDCPECGLQVSDKANSCPHCGLPMKQNITRPRNSNKRLRLPNGFGQITEIKNQNLRKPFRAMVTVGKDEQGKFVRKMLKPDAYFETYNDAYYALVEYNKHPYELEDTISIKELFDKWSKYYFKTLNSNSSIRTINAAWKYCSSVYNMRVIDLKVRHIKGCMDSVESPNIKSRIKSVFNLMLDYAVEYEIVDKNVAREFNIDKNIIKTRENNKKDHISFTDEELKLLWDNANDPLVSIILIQTYMGWRPQELGLLKLENVDLKNWNITGGMKTDSGTNRTVPICECIKPIIKNVYTLSSSINSDYLCCDKDGSLMTYDKYQKRFSKLMKELGMKHRPHDPRKTFVTICKKNGVDEYAVKKMVGHVIADITEKIYTDRDPDWLKNEAKKIKGL